ncbi:uncharacterized protein LY79DRAFT_318506 [Colletotrichum navitas]|uniref:Uncharacterized protein n=1 Tax=Colletotrichum navitas TaxID=681940 RepID=A0AAD8PU37_9PEZI|nr:uncharacterized protein LY79DRAFT_318506 [Colletotrichum navitas]KAK1580063.1 hypothetical protein LY79DRAFT_318506 [Colletotrichum navitas]
MAGTTSPTPALPRPWGYDEQPQNYLRIPGLVFDDVPALIPREHSAALRFLQPSDFELDMSFGEYYTLLEPLDRVANKLVDVFDYCIQVLRRSTGPVAQCPTGSSTGHSISTPSALWDGFFDQVLDMLGHAAEKVGLCSLDLMWIVYLYTRAWENTSKSYMARDGGYWRKANIHHLHDLLGEWYVMLRGKGIAANVIFGELFGIGR